MLVQELLDAKRDLVLPRLLKQWGRFDALLIDDLGYVQHSRQEMEVLFNLLAQRWTPFFGQPDSRVKVDSLWLICCPPSCPGFS